MDTGLRCRHLTGLWIFQKTIIPGPGGTGKKKYYFFPRVEWSSKFCIAAPRKLSSRSRTCWSLYPTATFASLARSDLD